MPLHDAYARITPYELALASSDFADERFRLVEEEATTQGFPQHLEDIRAFALLGEVGAMLRELRPVDDPPEMIDQYGLLLFHCYHFWRSEHPLYLIQVPAVREAVEGTGVDAVELADRGAAYLQLPQHLVWIPGDPNPESLDGVFMTWLDGELTAMAVAGVARNRGGVISLPLPAVPIAELPSISAEVMRSEGGDFSTDMPGADIDDLYGVQSAGEVLKLVARLLPALAGAERGSPPGPQVENPPPSEFNFRVVPSASS